MATNRVVVDVHGLQCVFDGTRWRCEEEPGLERLLNKWLLTVPREHVLADRVAELCLAAAGISGAVVVERLLGLEERIRPEDGVD